jgi:hypothetical protein
MKITFETMPGRTVLGGNEQLSDPVTRHAIHGRDSNSLFNLPPGQVSRFPLGPTCLASNRDLLFPSRFDPLPRSKCASKR